MDKQVELETSAKRIEKLDDRISCEFQFNNSQNIGIRLEKVSTTLKEKNEVIKVLYEKFSEVEEEMSRITDLMNQDPENTDNGVSYIKRR